MGVFHKTPPELATEASASSLSPPQRLRPFPEEGPGYLTLLAGSLSTRHRKLRQTHQLCWKHALWRSSKRSFTCFLGDEKRRAPCGSPQRPGCSRSGPQPRSPSPLPRSSLKPSLILGSEELRFLLFPQPAAVPAQVSGTEGIVSFTPVPSVPWGPGRPPWRGAELSGAASIRP